MDKNIDILFACDTNKSRAWYRDRIPAIQKAINKVEFSVVLVDIYNLLGDDKYNPSNVSERKLFLQTTDLIKKNKLFEKKIIELSPKVLILGTADNYCEFLRAETIRNIRNAGIYVVGILGDDEFNYPQYRFLIGWFDLFVAYVKPCLEYYEKFNVSKGYFFPNSCYLNDKEFIDHHQDTVYDAIIIGAPIANRAEMVTALVSSGLKVGIYGSPQWKNHELLKKYYLGFVPTEEFDQILSKGKIVLAFLEDHISGKLHMNTKIWEAVRVGRLPISTYYDRLINDYGLTENVNIIMYKDKIELIEKIQFYTKNDIERIKIAEALYENLKINFDYALMYTSFFNNLMSNQNMEVGRENSKNDFNISEFSGVSYFGNKYSHLDIDVVKHLEIFKKLDKNKFHYFYYNKLEEGERVISRWPFISFDSIIFLTGKKSKFECRLIFIMSFFQGKAFQINQFSITSSKKTLLGRINRVIDELLNTELGKTFKKKVKQRRLLFSLK